MQALSLLKHVFPPPRYITLPNVGVDISDTSLKYIQFERRRSRDTNLRLKAWGEVDIPNGVLEHGNVLDLPKLTDILKEVRKACGIEYVRVSLPEERAYLFETTVKQGTPFKEIRGLLEFKLEENVPLSPRDAFFDYDIVDSGEEDGVLHVVVTVYAKQTILNYQDACRGAGLTPLSFEVEASAITRAVVRSGFSGTYMIIDFGKTRLGIGIVHHESLMYTSTIDVGGMELSIALRNVLGDVSEHELTELKNTQGLVMSSGNKAARETLMKPLSTIADELETRIRYWGTRDAGNHERAVTKIILCGGSSNLLGFPEYLETALGVPVEHARVWQNAFSLEAFVPPIDKRHSFGYTTAIGLALTDFMKRTYD